jgi:hypothetical protein
MADHLNQNLDIIGRAAAALRQGELVARQFPLQADSETYPVGYREKEVDKPSGNEHRYALMRRAPVRTRSMRSITMPGVTSRMQA